ncbi:hypothetical protein [Amycolatopsis sp. NPDC052450]
MTVTNQVMDSFTRFLASLAALSGRPTRWAGGTPDQTDWRTQASGLGALA